MVYPIDSAVLPGGRNSHPPCENMERVLAAEAGCVLLLSGRKVGTLARHVDWVWVGRQRCSFPTFDCRLRARVVQLEERDGLLWAEVEATAPFPDEGFSEQVAVLHKGIRRYLRLMDLHKPSQRKPWYKLLKMHSAGKLAYALAEQLGRNRHPALQASKPETLLRIVTRQLAEGLVQRAKERCKCLQWESQRPRPAAQNRWDIQRHSLWRRYVRGSKNCSLPGLEGSNPLPWKDLLIAVVFSPGMVVAVDRATGRARWRRPLPKLAGRSPVIYEGILYVCNGHTLFALSPETGRLLWKFSPQQPSGEWFYSTPVVHDGRLFLGDRAGWLKALDATTGKLLWETQVCPGGHNVNATAYVDDLRVVTATNSAEAVACDPANGQVLWRAPLADSCITGLRSWNGGLLASTSSALELLCPATGVPLWSWSWESEGHLRWCLAAEILLVNVDEKLYAFHEGRLLYSGQPLSQMAELSYRPETGLVYESGYEGLSILEPSTGQRLYTFAPHRLLRISDPPGFCAGILYLLTADGYLHAIRHPPGTQSDP